VKELLDRGDNSQLLESVLVLNFSTALGLAWLLSLPLEVPELPVGLQEVATLGPAYLLEERQRRLGLGGDRLFLSGWLVVSCNWCGDGCH
jgi:hypothetical protein